LGGGGTRASYVKKNVAVEAFTAKGEATSWGTCIKQGERRGQRGGCPMECYGFFLSGVLENWCQAVLESREVEGSNPVHWGERRR